MLVNKASSWQDAGIVKCPSCNAKYRLSKNKVPWRDKDSLKCDRCGTVYHKWNASWVYEGRLITDENDAQ